MKILKKAIAIFSAAVLCAGAFAFALSGCEKGDKDLIVSYSFEDTQSNRTLNGANGRKYKITKKIRRIYINRRAILF